MKTYFEIARCDGNYYIREVVHPADGGTVYMDQGFGYFDIEIEAENEFELIKAQEEAKCGK